MIPIKFLSLTRVVVLVILRKVCQKVREGVDKSPFSIDAQNVHVGFHE